MSMTTDKANGLVLTALTVSGALVLIRDATDGDLPKPRFFVAWPIAGIGLAVLAQTMPDLAGGVAVLMIVASMLVYGAPAWQVISKGVSTS